MITIDPAVLATALAHAQQRIADLEEQIANLNKGNDFLARDIEQYRSYWLEDRDNMKKLARIGDKLRRVDPMAPCPDTEAWDKACVEYGVDKKEDDNG